MRTPPSQFKELTNPGASMRDVLPASHNRDPDMDKFVCLGGRGGPPHHLQTQCMSQVGWQALPVATQVAAIEAISERHRSESYHLASC